MLNRPERVTIAPDPHRPQIVMSGDSTGAELDRAAADLLTLIEAEPVPDMVRRLALELTQALQARHQQKD